MKKVEHPPSWENALCKFALSQGALALSQGAYPYSKSKDTTIIRIIKGFFGFLGRFPVRPGMTWGRFRVKPGMRKRGPGMRKGPTADPSTGSGTGRASDEGPALRRAQGPAE